MIFDAHFHIFDPSFSVKDYLKRVEPLQVFGGALVASSFQGAEQDYLIKALKELGKNFVAITHLTVDATDACILSSHDQGVRGARFAPYRGQSIKHLEEFAKRIYDFVGWHIELYTDKLDSSFAKLPKLVVDHLGLSSANFPTLLKLAEQGVKVKASGFGRLDFDCAEALKKIYAVNPDALLFGTDLPSTRAKRAFSAEDISLIKETFSEKQAEKILWKNAIAFYS